MKSASKCDYAKMRTARLCVYCETEKLTECVNATERVNFNFKPRSRRESLMTNSMIILIMTHLLLENILSIFSSNSEAFASEWLENIDEMFCRYYMDSDDQHVQIFNHTLMLRWQEALGYYFSFRYTSLRSLRLSFYKMRVLRSG